MQQPTTPEDALAALGDGPRRLAELVQTPEARWRQRPADGAWSAAAILAHLRAADDVLAPRLLQILARDNPALPAFDERRWQDVAGYDLIAPARSIATYSARREELIAALRRQPPAAWQRTGLHETAGEQTVLAITGWLAEHEREHLDSIERLLAPRV